MEKERQQPRISILGTTFYHKKRSKRYGKYWLLIFAWCILFCSCRNNDESVKILFVGDILLSRNVKEELKKRKTTPWERLEPLFKSADIVIGNLEGAVGEYSGLSHTEMLAPLFAIDSADIRLLKEAGFTAMVIENNHSLDLGINGKNKTIATLAENNIKSISLENSPYFFHTNSGVVSIVAINLIKNRDETQYAVPSIELQQKLRLARALSNVLIVSVHWGSELLDWPSADQRKVAKWLIQNGTDIIIGHHPHVIQQPELIDGKPVYFSLGNHLFDQKYSVTKEGLMAEVILKNGKLYCNGIKTVNQRNSFYPEVKGKSAHYFDPIDYHKTAFTLNKIKIIPENIDVLNKIRLNGYVKNKLLWKSHPMSLVTLQKIDIDKKSEHLFALESYYSSIDKEINIRPYVYSVDHKGINASWRGSALAWPLLDARISSFNNQILCALHRGDAFILPGTPIGTVQRVAAYKWNGFGFSITNDSTICRGCAQVYKP